jgi:dehydrodolichyl diphosphate syntase complex subunit NUS1
MNEPSRPRTNSTTQRKSRLGVRKFIKTQLYVLIFALMHGIFSLYIRTRQAWNIVGYQMSSVLFYHHATPQYIQKDVTGLSKLPNHLSAILRSENPRLSADLDRLIDETAELATWCACAGIPMLSVYEKTGTYFSSALFALVQKLTVLKES